MERKFLEKQLFPDAEEYWMDRGATLEPIEIDKGRTEMVPFFGHRAEPLSPPVAEEYVMRGDEIIGTCITHDTLMSNGVDRAARVYVPQNPRFKKFTVHMETPFMTSEKGHNDYIARQFMEQIGAPVVLVGPEYSTDQNCWVREFGRAALQTMHEVGSLSLAESAEAGMKICAQLCDEYGLPRQIVKVGESRAAMLAHAQAPYAKAAGLDIGYFDLTDPCSPEKVVRRTRDIAKVALWPATELAACAPVAFDMVRSGALWRQLGTLSGNPNELLAIAASTRYLLGDEAGKVSKFMPHDAGFHEAYFKTNKISNHKKWQEHFADNPLYGSVVLRGGHFNLGFSSVLQHVIDRVIRYGEQLEKDDQNIDWQQVHEPGKHNKADLSLVA